MCVCVISSQVHRFARREKKGAHLRHVADGHQVAGGRQVEAVHLVLHAAGDLAVATAKVGHHQRRRPGGKQTRVSEFLRLLKYWEENRNRR